MASPVTPYTAPRSDPYDPRPGISNPRTRLIRGLWFVGVVTFVLGIVLAIREVRTADTAMLGGSAVIFFIAFLLSSRHQFRLLFAPAGAVSAWAMLGNFGIVVMALGASAFGALSAFATTITFSRGRQLKRRGRPVFAELLELEEPVSSSSEAPSEVADAWRLNGLTEHASVAAFAKVSLELLSLGAPMKLIDAAHADALDESRHTDLCFDLATQIDGRRVRPGRFPRAVLKPVRGPRVVRLCRLAIDSLIDGAINEGVSARVVAELSKEVEDPAVGEVLRAIARDEGRHAVHGFDVLAWCVLVGGRPVHAAVKAAIDHLPERLGESHNVIAADGRYECFGLPSRDRENRAYAVVRDRTIERTRRLLLATENERNVRPT